MYMYMYVHVQVVMVTLTTPTVVCTHPQELRDQLQVALGEVEDLREARERQREKVEAIVKQRDMYRTLLAQTTPLPPETGLMPVAKVATPGQGEGSVAMVTTVSQVDQETSQALKVCTCTCVCMCV